MRYPEKVHPRRLARVGAVTSLWLVPLIACGGGSKSSAVDGGSTLSDGSSEGPEARGDGASPGDASSPFEGAPPLPEGGPTKPGATCTPPIQPVDVSTPTTVVGTGTASSCTEAALDAAVAKAGIITFNCGGPATISVTKQIELSLTVDTTLDGGGMITLDGGNAARILDFDSPNFRATMTTVTLQNLTFAHGKATGTPIPMASPPCSQGFEIDGGGAAVWMRDGVLHVIDSTFENNVGAAVGPDVGGGAIYVVGSLDITIVGSSFTSNSASNSGAVGSLFSNLTIVNDVFTANQATGNGENYIDTTDCSVEGGESGNGGNSGAVGMDGGETFSVSVCGDVFENNQANALAGAIGRTPDGAVAATIIDRCTFDGNSAGTGGGALYFHNSDLTITASTLSNNTAPGAGAIQADSTTFTFTNDTFAGNSATNGLGGAISLFSPGGGTLTNVTFANNTSGGGSGLFAAAIAGGTSLTINNTIFDGNTSQDCGSPMACSDGSSTGTGDLQWPMDHVVCTTADTPCVPGITFADAELGALANNGGTTMTLVPMAGSPAIGVGTGCPATDQRGQPRKNASACTAGAVEAD
jgi:predicted outer membrane repeat protein